MEQCRDAFSDMLGTAESLEKAVSGLAEFGEVATASKKMCATLESSCAMLSSLSSLLSDIESFKVPEGERGGFGPFLAYVSQTLRDCAKPSSEVAAQLNSSVVQMQSLSALCQRAVRVSEGRTKRRAPKGVSAPSVEASHATTASSSLDSPEKSSTSSYGVSSSALSDPARLAKTAFERVRRRLEKCKNDDEDGSEKFVDSAQQVEYLIAEAHSERNLCRMYEGWCSWC
jgi:hypothetical protein